MSEAFPASFISPDLPPWPIRRYRPGTGSCLWSAHLLRSLHAILLPKLLPVQPEVVDGGCGHLLPFSQRWLLWLIQQLKMEERREQPSKSSFISSGVLNGLPREASPIGIPCFCSLTDATIPLTYFYRYKASLPHNLLSTELCLTNYILRLVHTR